MFSDFKKTFNITINNFSMFKIIRWVNVISEAYSLPHSFPYYVLADEFFNFP